MGKFDDLLQIDAPAPAPVSSSRKMGRIDFSDLLAVEPTEPTKPFSQSFTEIINKVKPQIPPIIESGKQGAMEGLKTVGRTIAGPIVSAGVPQLARPGEQEAMEVAGKPFEVPPRLVATGISHIIKKLTGQEAIPEKPARIMNISMLDLAKNVYPEAVAEPLAGLTDLMTNIGLQYGAGKGLKVYKTKLWGDIFGELYKKPDIPVEIKAQLKAMETAIKPQVENISVKSLNEAVKKARVYKPKVKKVLPSPVVETPQVPEVMPQKPLPVAPVEAITPKVPVIPTPTDTGAEAFGKALAKKYPPKPPEITQPASQEAAKTPITEPTAKPQTDIKDLDAQIRTIEKPTKDFNKWTVEIGTQESLGEQGGDIITEFFEKEPTIKDIRQRITEHYKDEKARINEEVVMGITAKSGRDEMVEGAIDKVLQPTAKGGEINPAIEWGKTHPQGTVDDYIKSRIKPRDEKRRVIQEWKQSSGYKEVDSSFKRGVEDESIHAPASPESGSPLYSLTEKGIYPDDVYSVNGRRYYGTGEDRMDNLAYNIISEAEGNPNKEVKIYRAIEKDGANKINPGDWVTTVRGYATEHGRGNIKGEFKILSKTVKAKDIFTSGDSWLEWGYHPQPEIPRSVYIVDRVKAKSEYEQSKLSPKEGEGVKPAEKAKFPKKPIDAKEMQELAKKQEEDFIEKIDDNASLYQDKNAFWYVKKSDGTKIINPKPIENEVDTHPDDMANNTHFLDDDEAIEAYQQAELKAKEDTINKQTIGKLFDKSGQISTEYFTAIPEAIQKNLDAIQYQVKHPLAKSIINDFQYVNIKATRSAADWFSLVDNFKGIKDPELLSDVVEGKKQAPNKEILAQAERVKTALRAVYQKASEAGVKVKEIDDDGNISWRPIGQIKDYLPREINPEIREKLDIGLKELYAKIAELKNKGVRHNIKEALLQEKKSGNTYIVRLIEFLESKGIKTTPARILALLNKLINRDYIGQYGHLERPRTADELPPEFYERNAVKLIARYFAHSARRIAEVEKFGTTNEKLLSRLRMLEVANPEEGAKLRQMMNYYQDKTKHKFSSNVATAISTLKIGLGTSTIPNITQTLISTIPKQGVWTFIKAGLDMFNPAKKELLNKTGLPFVDVIHGLYGYDPEGILGKVNDFLLKWNWFKGVNRLNALLTASSTEKWIKSVLLPKATSGGKYQKAWALDNLKKLKIEPSDIKDGKISDDKLVDAMLIAAQNYQLFSDITNEPVFMGDPKLRWLFILKRFGYKQVLFTSHEIIYDELIKHKNPLPILRLLAGGLLGGAFVLWAKNKLWDIIAVGKEYATGEYQEKPDWLTNKDDLTTWQQAVDLISQAGALGVISDLVRLDKSGNLAVKRALEFQLTPVIISEIVKTGEIADTLLKSTRKRGRHIVEVPIEERVGKAFRKLLKEAPISKYFMQD